MGRSGDAVVVRRYQEPHQEDSQHDTDEERDREPEDEHRTLQGARERRRWWNPAPAASWGRRGESEGA